MTREPLKKRLQTHYKILGVGGGGWGGDRFIQTHLKICGQVGNNKHFDVINGFIFKLRSLVSL